MTGELVKTITADKLVLNGFYCKGDTDKPLILYIHGYEEDFYTNSFIKSIGIKLQENKYAFLTVETRGSYHLNDLEVYGEGSQTHGAQKELLEQSYLDIDGWIKFAQAQGYKNIILQGYSLGAIKIVRYLFEGQNASSITKLILLCPFDSIYCIQAYTKGKYKEYIEDAKRNIQEGKGEELVPRDFDEIPISYQTYASWYSDSDMSHMFDFYDKNYDFPILNKVKVPVHIIVGTGDPFFHPSNPQHPEEAVNILLKNLKQGSGKLIKGATHSFAGYEDKVAEEILNFLKK